MAGALGLRNNSNVTDLETDNVVPERKVCFFAIAHATDFYRFQFHDAG